LFIGLKFLIFKNPNAASLRRVENCKLAENWNFGIPDLPPKYEGMKPQRLSDRFP
jgi:hypothetical protein